MNQIREVIKGLFGQGSRALAGPLHHFHVSIIAETLLWDEVSQEVSYNPIGMYVESTRSPPQHAIG
jgi:hypothetical protein